MLLSQAAFALLGGFSKCIRLLAPYVSLYEDKRHGFSPTKAGYLDGLRCTRGAGPTWDLRPELPNLRSRRAVSSGREQWAVQSSFWKLKGWVGASSVFAAQKPDKRTSVSQFSPPVIVIIYMLYYSCILYLCIVQSCVYLFFDPFLLSIV